MVFPRSFVVPPHIELRVPRLPFSLRYLFNDHFHLAKSFLNVLVGQIVIVTWGDDYNYHRLESLRPEYVADMVDVCLESGGSRGALDDQHKGIDLVGTCFIKSNDLSSELSHDLINLAFIKAGVSEASGVNDVDFVFWAIPFP